MSLDFLKLIIETNHHTPDKPESFQRELIVYLE